MKFSLHYPAKPFRLNQAWGIFNPAYQQFGFSKHNGIDIALGTDSLLYAPCGGTIVRTGNQPTGGGIFLGLMTDYYDWPDGKYRVLLDFLHCDSLRVKEGQEVKVGEVLAVADNTGFSTGPHTHIQPRRIKWWNGKAGKGFKCEFLDKNDANGSFDLLPYFTRFHAQDHNTLISLVQRIALLINMLRNTEGK